MINFKEYLKESLDKPYRFRQTFANNVDTIYTFTTDSGLDYTVRFETVRLNPKTSVVEISFTYNDHDYDKLSNTNDFKVGSTIVQIMKEFIHTSEIWDSIGILHLDVGDKHRLNVYDRIVRRRIKSVKITKIKKGSGGHIIIFDKSIDGIKQRKVLETF